MLGPTLDILQFNFSVLEYTLNFVTHGPEKTSRYLCLLFVVFWLSSHEFDDMILHRHVISQMFLENIDPRFGNGGVTWTSNLIYLCNFHIFYHLILIYRKNFPMKDVKRYSVSS